LISLCWVALGAWRLGTGDWTSFLLVSGMGLFWLLTTCRVIYSFTWSR
jgi:hypothetical protein